MAVSLLRTSPAKLWQFIEFATCVGAGTLVMNQLKYCFCHDEALVYNFYGFLIGKITYLAAHRVLDDMMSKTMSRCVAVGAGLLASAALIRQLAHRRGRSYVSFSGILVQTALGAALGMGAREAIYRTVVR